MEITILGAGNVGAGLATAATAPGHVVVSASSQDVVGPQKAAA